MFCDPGVVLISYCQAVEGGEGVAVYVKNSSKVAKLWLHVYCTDHQLMMNVA